LDARFGDVTDLRFVFDTERFDPVDDIGDGVVFDDLPHGEVDDAVAFAVCGLCDDDDDESADAADLRLE